jgi:hypothetical protein
MAAEGMGWPRRPGSNIGNFAGCMARWSRQEQRFPWWYDLTWRCLPFGMIERQIDTAMPNRSAIPNKSASKSVDRYGVRGGRPEMFDDAADIMHGAAPDTPNHQVRDAAERTQHVGDWVKAGHVCEHSPYGPVIQASFTKDTGPPARSARLGLHGHVIVTKAAA